MFNKKRIIKLESQIKCLEEAVATLQYNEGIPIPEAGSYGTSGGYVVPITLNQQWYNHVPIKKVVKLILDSMGLKLVAPTEIDTQLIKE